MFGNFLRPKWRWFIIVGMGVIVAICLICEKIKPIDIPRSAVTITLRVQDCRDFLIPAIEDFYRKSNANNDSKPKKSFQQFATEDYEHSVFVIEKPNTLRNNPSKYGIFLQLPAYLHNADEGQIIAYTQPIKTGKYSGARCAILFQDSKLETRVLSETEFRSAIQNEQKKTVDIYFDLDAQK
jgi:hypothetical protein